MTSISNSDELNKAILSLEEKQNLEEILLKEQFNSTYESIKPINLIRDTYKEIVSSPNFNQDFVTTAMSLASGYLSKKIAIGSTHNPFKQILGGFLQIGVTKVVAENAHVIKNTLLDIFKAMFEKKGKE